MHALEQHAIIAGLPTLVPAGAAAPPQQPPLPLPHPPQVEGLAAAAAAAAELEGAAFEGFEGPEKTLEIDLLRGAGGEADADGRCGLRRIPREQWNELLDLAACKILSTVSNEHIDSYVLSESSLFVLSHKVMLKTCGTTTLLRIVPPLLAAIARLGMKVEWFNYSRKNFTYPHKQLSPHQSFDAEIAYLSTHFPGGEAFMLGPLNADHWYVYDWSSDESAAPGALEQSKDVVLDLMMFDMDPAVAAIFYKGEEEGVPAAAAGAPAVLPHRPDSRRG
jgi:S-adenosylmethionine decarboxylase